MFKCLHIMGVKYYDLRYMLKKIARFCWMQCQNAR